MVAVGEYIGRVGLSVTIGFLFLYLIKGGKLMRRRPITDRIWILWILVAVGEYIGHVNLSVTFDFLLLYSIKRRKMMRHRPMEDSSWILL